MNRVFGMDVHRDLLVTTVKTEDGEETRYSGVSMEDLNSLMDWLRQKRCHKGAIESSGVYLVPIYTSINRQCVSCDSNKRNLILEIWRTL